MEAIKVLTDRLQFPEGPAFDSKGGLWLVELKGGSLVRFFENKFTRFFVGGAPNGIAIDKNDMVWFCDSLYNAIRTFHLGTGQIATVVTTVDDECLNKPNDLVFDKKGNLLFSCPGDSRKEPTGYVGVLTPDGFTRKIITGKYFPNGLAFADTGKVLILAETYRHRLWKYVWDTSEARVLEEKVWCDIGGPDGPGGPDGMAFHENQQLYVAIFGTGEIRIAGQDGSMCGAIKLPGKNPTNCAFDPSGRLGLVITEAEKGELLSVNLSKILLT